MSYYEIGPYLVEVVWSEEEGVYIATFDPQGWTVHGDTIDEATENVEMLIDTILTSPDMAQLLQR